MCKNSILLNPIYQPLTPFLPSYFDKNLFSPSKFCIFAPAIEGNALGAWQRASLKTEAGDKWWQAPVINDDPEKDKKRGYPGSCKKMNLINTQNDYD